MNKVKKWVNNIDLRYFRFWFQLISFFILVYSGRLAIDLGRNSPTFSCGYNRENGGVCYLLPLQRQLAQPWSHLFSGMGMALTPRSPLSTVLLVSVASASALTAVSLGFSFAMGAVMVPALIFGLGVAYFGQRIREILVKWRKTLEHASGLVLIIMGLGTIYA